MPTLPTYPGVYVEELPSSVRTITAVTTSVCAFVGRTRRGPLNSAVTLTSFADYERRFGGLDSGAVGHAVQQFFLNGGSVAVVVRVDSGGGKPAAVQLSSAEITPAADVLEITTREPGTWGSGLRVSVDHDTETPGETFNLRVFDSSGGVQESFTGLSMAEDHARSVDSTVNSGSAVIQVKVLNRDGRPDPVGTVSKKFDSVPSADVLSKTVDVKIGDKAHTFKIYEADKDGDTPPASVTALALLLERKLRALPDLPGKRVFRGARVAASDQRLQVVAGSEDPSDTVRFTGENANDLGLEGSVNPPVFLLEDGADGGDPGAADLIGSEAGKTGIHALRSVQDVNLLSLPELAGYDQPRRHARRGVGRRGAVPREADVPARRRAGHLDGHRHRPRGPRRLRRGPQRPRGPVLPPVGGGRPAHRPAARLPALRRHRRDHGAHRQRARRVEGTGRYRGPPQRRPGAHRPDDRPRERPAQPRGRQLSAVLPRGGAGRLGSTHTGRLRRTGLPVEVRARAPPRAHARGEPVPRHPVGRLRAQRPAAVDSRSG